MKKKIIAGILSLTMVFGLVAAKQNFGVSAASTSSTSVSSSDTTKNIDSNWEYSVDANGRIMINRYKGTSRNVVVPSYINGRKVVRIGTRAFASCYIYDVVIPEGVLVIGNEAFWGCFGLKEVKLPNSITTIREGAFMKSSVETINIPSKVTSIGKNAFKDSWLSKITISEGLMNIKEGAFENCTKLKEINLPSSLQTIGTKAFYGSKLEYIKIPSGVSTIGDYAFAYTPVGYVVMPKGVTKIGVFSFAYCGNLCEIALPDGLNTISDYAFYKSDIRRAIIPSSVTYIGSKAYTASDIETLVIKGRPKFAPDAFVDCKYLKNLTMDLNFKFNGSIFNGCTAINRINNYLTNGIGSKGVPFFNSPIKQFIFNNFKTASNVGFIDTYVKEQAKYIVAQITTKDMSQVQKAVAIQKWICEKTEYNHKDVWAPSGFVDSSVFLNDLTVCNGYARATALLLQAAGLEAYFVNNGIHAWNIVKITFIFCISGHLLYVSFNKCDFFIRKTVFFIELLVYFGNGLTPVDVAV